MENPLQLFIEVKVYSCETGQNLNISEQFFLSGLGFADLCKILGQFHDLAAKIKEERKKG